MRARAEPSFPARLAMTGLAVLIAAVLYLARRAFLLVYLSGLLAVALSPLVRRVERLALRPIGRFRLPRWLAILVIYLGVVAALIGVGFLVLPPLIAQGQHLVAALPDLLGRTQRFLAARGVPQEATDPGHLVQRLGEGDMVANLTGTLSSVIGGAVGILVVVFLTFYFLVESDLLFAEALRFFPPRRRPQVERSALAITGKVSGWLGGHAMLGAIVATTSAVVLWLLGEPYFYVLAVVGFIGEFVPYVGMLLTACAAVAIACTVSWTLALEVAGFYVILGQIEGNVLAPRIFERQVGLSAPSVIVAMLIGGELAGVIGVVLAIPTAAILQVLVEQIVLHGEPAPEVSAPPADDPLAAPGETPRGVPAAASRVRRPGRASTR